MFCKQMTKRSASLRRQGATETELRKLDVLGNNLMMNGCRFVQENIERILDLLDKEQQNMTVVVDFEQYPPDIELLPSNNSDESPGNLECRFVTSVLYRFAVDHEEGFIVLNKGIPMDITKSK